MYEATGPPCVGDDKDGHEAPELSRSSTKKVAVGQCRPRSPDDGLQLKILKINFQFIHPVPHSVFRLISYRRRPGGPQCRGRVCGSKNGRRLETKTERNKWFYWLAEGYSPDCHVTAGSSICKFAYLPFYCCLTATCLFAGR